VSRCAVVWLLLIAFAGCKKQTPIADPSDAQAVFAQVQADAEKKDVERIWGEIDKKSQIRLKKMADRQAADGGSADPKELALEQIRSILLGAKVQDTRIVGKRAYIAVELPDQGEGPKKRTIDMLKEDDGWKIALFTE